MGTTSLSEMSVSDLLIMHTGIADELRLRGFIRSTNNPVGDFAEYLFCAAFGWTQAPASETGFDATDEVTGLRYQIKGRRPHLLNASRQLSALRRLDQSPFDVLAAVLFTLSYAVLRAALIPIDVVRKFAKYGGHSNSFKFILRESVWNEAGVSDVKDQLAAALP